MVKESPTLLAYHMGTSALHRVPSYIKILALLAMSIFIFIAPKLACYIALAIECLSLGLLGVRLGEFIADLIPTIAYALCLYSTSFLALFIFYMPRLPILECLRLSTIECFCNATKALYLVKVSSLALLASLLYKTTTSLSIASAIAGIISYTLGLVKLQHYGKTLILGLSIFTALLPLVPLIYRKVLCAYYARYRKRGLFMYVRLLPVLLLSILDSAYRIEQAIKARGRLLLY